MRSSGSSTGRRSKGACPRRVLTGSGCKGTAPLGGDRRVLRSSRRNSSSTAPNTNMSQAMGASARKPVPTAESPRKKGTAIISPPPRMSWIAAPRRRRGVQVDRRREVGAGMETSGLRTES